MAIVARCVDLSRLVRTLEHIYPPEWRAMSSTARQPRLQVVLTWSTRLSWIITSAALIQAFSTLDVGLTVTVSTWLLWVIGAVSIFVGSPLTLTLARVTIPLAIPAAIIGIAAGAHVALGAIGLSGALIACYSVFTAEVGQRWVQSAAYGSERRFPLRPPIGFAIPAVILWVLVASVALCAVIAAERSQVALSILLGAVVVALSTFGSTRWHRLSCRWLVLVPAGVVIHDPLVLLETAMWRSHIVGGATLARVETEAADLTGPTTGPAIEISLRSSETVVLAAGRQTPEGRAIHLTAALVAPSRPGAALDALQPSG